MAIVNYKLETTKDLLTSRAGLLTVAHLMDSLNLAQHIDQNFPLPKSHRGYPPSKILQALILMQHEGSFHLDDIRHLKEDKALRTILGLKQLPAATTLGEWLRRIGKQKQIQDNWVQINKILLNAALHRCKQITLDIDATEIISHKANAQWTYKKNKGFMPMVGHIAQTGQVVAVDFRQGNVPPSKDNLSFIKQCQASLPKGCSLNALRIDAAGYQSKIIQYCDEQNIEYAIRAKTSRNLREQIKAIKASDWQPMVSKNGEIIKGQDTYRTPFCIKDYEHAFTLIIQRKAIEGQSHLELEDDSEEIKLEGYIYRAIATNRDKLSDSQIIHWYNQRAEDSENRIKELKLDFGADTLPCSDFNANALYFLISALSYNVFALMRQLLPEKLTHHRAMTLRWRLYGMAAKVVKTGRRFYIKLQEKNHRLLSQVLEGLRAFEPIPI